MNGSKLKTSSGHETKDSVCRIVVLGCPGVGKTALIVRFLTKRFIGEYCPTLESIYKYTATLDDDDVRLEILDTAGQVQAEWKEGYALWGDCFVFVYSITDRVSLEELRQLKQQVESAKKSTAVPCVLVGNKTDLVYERCVSEGEGRQMSEWLGCMSHLEVSASDWTQMDTVSEVFLCVSRDWKRVKASREGRQRKTSSSTKFKQAIQKVISGKTTTKKNSAGLS